MKALKLPSHLRRKLRKSLGILLRGNNYVDVAAEAVNMLRTCSHTIAVGDICCESLVRAGFIPDVCVIDRRTLRQDREPELPIGIFNKVVHVRNPPSTITEEAEEAVSHAIQESLNNVKTLVLVSGEEDLLTLTAIMYSHTGFCVTYGQPSEGLVIVKVDRGIKDLVKHIVSKFAKVTI